MKPIRQMTQLEHFSYIRIMFKEAEVSHKGLAPVFKELLKYCEQHNADYEHTVSLL